MDARLGPVISSLRACAAAAVKPRTPLGKAIRLVLLVKLIGIAGLTLVTVAERDKLHVDAAAAARMIGVPAAP